MEPIQIAPHTVYKAAAAAQSDKKIWITASARFRSLSSCYDDQLAVKRVFRADEVVANSWKSFFSSPPERRHNHLVSGIQARNSKACCSRTALECKQRVQVGSDDLGQAELSVDDVPIWMGIQKRSAVHTCNQVRATWLFDVLSRHAKVSAIGKTRSGKVVVQWDPDHGWDGSRRRRRAIQIGMRGSVALEFAAGVEGPAVRRAQCTHIAIVTTGNIN